jgi:hypothetical protein
VTCEIYSLAEQNWSCYSPELSPQARHHHLLLLLPPPLLLLPLLLLLTVAHSSLLPVLCSARLDMHSPRHSLLPHLLRQYAAASRLQCFR